MGGGSGVKFLVSCTAESDGHNLGAHMHQEEPRNRCQEPVATPLLGNDSIEMPRLRLYGHGQPRHGGGEEPPDELRMNEAGNSTVVSVNNFNALSFYLSPLLLSLHSICCGEISSMHIHALFQSNGNLE